MGNRALAGRTIVIALLWSLLALAAAQPSTVGELAFALRTDAMELEEPLGIEVDCEPYLATFPDMSLSCFALSMPPTTMQGRFGEYVGSHESLEWMGEWEPVSELPDHLDPEDRHIRRGIESASGPSYVITIFKSGYFNHIVVAGPAE